MGARCVPGQREEQIEWGPWGPGWERGRVEGTGMMVLTEGKRGIEAVEGLRI